MAKAIFVVPFVEGAGPDLDSRQLMGSPPVEGYGWSCIGHVPQAKTILVLIVSTDEVLDALAADSKYLFVEDVDDGKASEDAR